MLAARSAQTLQGIVRTIEIAGGVAIAAACDVALRKDVERVAETAISQFGRIDTWVNDAGVSIYGRLDEVDDPDNRRLFDTNFWGVVNGSLAALPKSRCRLANGNDESRRRALTGRSSRPSLSGCCVAHGIRAVPP